MGDETAEFLRFAKERTRKILAHLPRTDYNVGEVVAMAYLLGVKDAEAVISAEEARRLWGAGKKETKTRKR